MGFWQITGLIVNLSFLLGIALLITSVGMILIIILARVMVIARDKRRQRLLDVWRPILVRSAYEVPEHLPRLRKSDWVDFLLLWNHFRETLRGEVEERLNTVARAARIGKAARVLIKSGRLRETLIAVSTLGYLGDWSSWSEIQALIQRNNPTLSLTCAMALSRIDPEAAARVVIPLIVAHQEYPPYKVVNVLKQLGPENISAPLAEAVWAASDEDTPRLVRYLVLAKRNAALPVIRRKLRETSDSTVISACLSVLGRFADKRDLTIVRNYLYHPDWYIRVKAANILGTAGVREDERVLAEKLSDEEWWVRYRTAQALGKLPFMTTARLEEIRDGQTDRYAKDILSQVIVERSIM